MMQRKFLLVVCVTLSLNAHADASGFKALLRKLEGCVPAVCKLWCCDDYEPKCAPTVCASVDRCPDDYCPKPLPAICIDRQVVTDDYRPKCAPMVRVVDTNSAACR